MREDIWSKARVKNIKNYYFLIDTVVRYILIVIIPYIGFLLLNKNFLEIIKDSKIEFKEFLSFIKIVFNLSSDASFITIIFIVFNMFFSAYIAFKFIQKKCPFIISDNIYIRLNEKKDSIKLTYRVFNTNYKLEKLINVYKSLELLKVEEGKKVIVVQKLSMGNENNRPILEICTNSSSEIKSMDLHEDLYKILNKKIEENVDNEKINEKFLFRAVVTAQSTINGQVYTAVKYFSLKNLLIEDYEQFFEVKYDDYEPKYYKVKKDKFNLRKKHKDNDYTIIKKIIKDLDVRAFKGTIGYITLYCNNIKESREFYEKYFGAKGNIVPIEDEYFSSCILNFKEGTKIKLVVFDNSKIKSSAPMVSSLSFSFGSKEKIQSLINQLIKDGYILENFIQETGDGYFEAYISDPFGNKIEIRV